MAISYNLLWKKLIDLGMSKTDMMRRANISTNVLARLSKGEPVSMDSMEKICKVLNCNIGDAMEFVTDEANGGKNA
ncbi:helix-turn-helix domain-containing protein [Hydrogeniiclostridium mannosilyticum]|uniref:helix-turn-helix domain-containing protein n=1 Tax=Hydrogeniiclostridium mannosilyticum TaxID=2764322 RepID=UPI00399A5BAE